MSYRSSLRNMLLRGSVVSIGLDPTKACTVVPAGCDCLCFSMKNGAEKIRLSRLAIHFTTTFGGERIRIHVPFYAIKAVKELPGDYVWQAKHR